ncbi:MAG: hypothetical protein MZW92_22765 [Comamonadaceae bacterium]|nr:hypothetical protein [Comamonadaceae bacterium]
MLRMLGSGWRGDPPNSGGKPGQMARGGDPPGRGAGQAPAAPPGHGPLDSSAPRASRHRPRSDTRDDEALGVLDRPRRHLHRHRRPRPGRARCTRSSCCRRTPSSTATRRSRASAACSGCAPASRSRRSASTA